MFDEKNNAHSWGGGTITRTLGAGRTRYPGRTSSTWSTYFVQSIWMICIGRWLWFSWRLSGFSTMIRLAALPGQSWRDCWITWRTPTGQNMGRRWMPQNGSWCLAGGIPLDRGMVSCISRCNDCMWPITWFHFTFFCYWPCLWLFFLCRLWLRCFHMHVLLLHFDGLFAPF